MKTITQYKHEIMWWMSRLTIMLTSLFLSFTLASSAYAAEIKMGSGGNLVFNTSELTVNAGDTVTLVYGELPPHNVVVLEHEEVSHPDVAFMSGEQGPVTVDRAGDYGFQCEPHAGAGMKGVICVQ